jgi:hypothetical protein
MNVKTMLARAAMTTAVLLASAGCGSDQTYTLEIPAPRLESECEGQVSIASLYVKLAETVHGGTSVCEGCIQIDPPAVDSESLESGVLKAVQLCPEFRLTQGFKGALLARGYSAAGCQAAELQACGFSSNAEVAEGRNSTLPRILLECDATALSSCP